MEIDIRINGPAELQTCSRTIREGDTVRVGRSPATGIEIPWDRRISREQADLYFDGDQLHIKCLDEARNPILCGRRAFREVSLHVGAEFRIGETRFTLRESEASTRDSLNQQFADDTPEDAVENSYSSQELSGVGLSNSERQLEILAGLPEMMTASQTDDEFVSLIVERLLEGIEGAEGAVIAQFDDAWVEDAAGPEVLTRPVMIRVKTRPGFEGQFRPSRRLILRSLREQQSLVHLWGSGEGGLKFTLSDGLGWAFCVPLQHDVCRGWCLFVAGRLTQAIASENEIGRDLRFAELLAQFVVAMRHVRSSTTQRARLATTFAAGVVRTLTTRNTDELLEPAERELTTLYCTVRGLGTSSPETPQGLRDVFDSIRETSGIVVSGILDRAGTIADVGPTAAMGVWGWPLRHADGPLPACQAALDIARSFIDESLHKGSALEGISLGIGLAHGVGVAGQLAPPPQAKVGAHGPAVSEGVQLAECARHFGVTICMDHATACWVQARLKKSDGRVRRLGLVRASHDADPLDVYCLLPPLAEAPAVTDEIIRLYDAAIEALQDGHWQEAQAMLTQMPGTDGPAKLLLQKIAETAGVPPIEWDGAFTL